MDSKLNQAIIKGPFDLLRLSLDELILVKLENGRRLVGKLHAYDLHLNMLLGDVEETITEIDIDSQSYEDIFTETKRMIPIIFVRGNGIILISPARGNGDD